MTDIITFQTLVLRDDMTVNIPKYGRAKVGGTAAEDDDVFTLTDATVYTKKEVEQTFTKAEHGIGAVDMPEDAVVLGGKGGKKYNDFYALVSETDSIYDDSLTQLLSDGAEFEAHKLADTGNGSRLNGTVGKEEDDGDPLFITAHGRVNNGNIGDLSERIRFSDEGGFGLDNGPDGEGMARYLNSGDSLTFNLNGDKAIGKFVFEVNGKGGTPQTIGLDFDGDVMNTADGDAEGKAKRNETIDDAALVLEDVAAGSTVEIDFENSTIKIISGEGDVELLSGQEVDSFLSQAGAPQALTLGSLGGSGFKAKDVEIHRADVGLAGAFADGNAQLSYEIDTKTNDGTPKGLFATLDLDLDGNPEIRELLSTSTGQFFFTGDVDSDESSASLQGDADPIDLLGITTFGRFDSRIGEPNSRGQLQPGDPDFQQQFGQLRTGNGGLTVDSGGAAASEDDGSSQGGNFGDEGNGNRDFNNGEIMRFDLGEGIQGVSGLLDFNYDLGTNAGDDVKVELFDVDAFGTVTLLQVQTFDLDVVGTSDISIADAFGDLFNRVEITALAPVASNLALDDADFNVLFAPGGPGVLGVLEVGDRIELDIQGNPFAREYENGEQVTRVQNVSDFLDANFKNLDVSSNIGAVFTGRPEGLGVTSDETGGARFAERAINLGETLIFEIKDDSAFDFATGAAIEFSSFNEPFDESDTVRIDLFSGDTLFFSDTFTDPDGGAGGVTSRTLSDLFDGCNGAAFDRIGISADEFGTDFLVHGIELAVTDFDMIA